MIFQLRSIARAALICAMLNFSGASFAVSVAAQTKAPLINEQSLRADTKFLSDDALEGRGTGARGGMIAAKYIASQLERAGIKGAGANGSYYQPVSLVGVKIDPATVLTLRGQNGEESFKFADDYVAFTGAQSENVPINAELVFVGYGIEAPEQHWNDYKGGADDYRNKILVMLVNDPPATKDEPNLFGGRALTYYGRWTYKYEEAARRGALGAILLHTDESAGYPWSVVRTSNGSWRFDLARAANDSTPYLQMRSWMTDAAAHRLMKLGGYDLDELRARAASRDFKPINLKLTASINIKSEVQRANAPNVVGVLEGRDPALKDQYVVYSAHWDHLGIGSPNARGDRIYNGAVDNATGVAAVLAIAEALAQLPASERPRRSSLFLFPTAEEQGLLGAEWFSKHPIVPLDKIAADINLDSMNILGVTRDIAPLGAERSTLAEVFAAVAARHNLKVVADQQPEQGSFYRSDHFPMAKVGIPAVSLKEGLDFVGHPAGWGEEQFKAYNTANYHQPSDEYQDAWDFRGIIQQVEISLEAGRRISDADQMPRYNAKDEFAKARAGK